MLSITDQNEAVGMLRMVFSSPRSWKAAKVPVNQTQTYKKANLYSRGFMGPSIYGGAQLWVAVLQAKMGSRE